MPFQRGHVAMWSLLQLPVHPYLSLTMGWNIVKCDSHYIGRIHETCHGEKPIRVSIEVPPKIVLIAALFCLFLLFFFLFLSLESRRTQHIIRWIAAVSAILINPRPAPRNDCVLVSLKLCSQTSEAKEFSF